MAKRRGGFFDYVRSLFSYSSSSYSDSKPRKDKEKRRRWLFGKLSSKRSSPALLPPSSSSALKSRALEEAEEQQSKHALAVAVATAAAAEAAVAAAQAAAEVVRLTGLPSSSGYHSSHESAAVRIQTAFRGYLARRALRALKGLVKLQALVRGRAVRRQTNIAMKNLQSLIKIQTEARVHRMMMMHESQALQDKDPLHQRRTKELADVGTKMDQSKDKKWDSSPLSKEKASAMFAYRQEAAMKRERALEYASSRRQGRRSCSRRHSLPLEREPEETEEMNRRWSWLEQWVGTQPWDTTNVRDIRPVPSPEKNPHEQQERVLRTVPDLDPHPLKRNSNKKEEEDEQEFRPPMATMRRSFNRSRRGYIRDDESFTSSPAFPSYMQFTESAKARSRSISTPKQRFGVTPDIFPDNYTLQSSRHLSPFTSVCSDASVAKLTRASTNNRCQKSPRLKAPAPMVPHRSSKDFRKEP